MQQPHWDELGLGLQDVVRVKLVHIRIPHVPLSEQMVKVVPCTRNYLMKC